MWAGRLEEAIGGGGSGEVTVLWNLFRSLLLMHCYARSTANGGHNTEIKVFIKYTNNIFNDLERQKQ
jgi:hypothetical protein